MLALYLAFLLLISTPCLALPVETRALGITKQATSVTNVLTTAGYDCPVGSLPVLMSATATTADTLSTVTDQALNVWATPIDNITGTSVGSGVSYAINTANDIPSGHTITAHYLTGTPTTTIAVTCVIGAATTSPLDLSDKTSQGTSATSATATSTGTLSQANEIVLGLVAGSANFGTLVCGGNFTKFPQLIGSPTIAVCAETVTSTASVTFSPTWANSVNYVLDIVTFKTSPTPQIGARATVGAGQ